MSRKRPISPFCQHARSIAFAIFRAKYGIPDDELKDVVPSRVLSREQQVREKYQVWRSPRLARAVAAELQDIENRAMLDVIDSWAWLHAKMPTGTRSVYKFLKLRERLFGQSLSWIIGDLRDRRLDDFAERTYLETRNAHLAARGEKALLEDIWAATEKSGKTDEAKDEDADKITIYKAPPRTATMERDERGRDAIRKRLAIQYRVLGWTDRHEIDEVFSELYVAAPWLAEPIQWLWEHQLLNLDDERKKVGFPPMLLVGPPGCGKTHIARLLGDIVGLKTARIDMSARSSAFDISGTEYVWRSSAPGIPVRTLGASDHANPLIVLDEIDKSGATSGGDPVEALLPLLQPDMARDFVCPFLQGTIDLSWISWIGTANDLRRVPDPIKDRVKIFRVEAPRGEGLRQVVAAQLGPVGADAHVVEEVCLRIESGEMSLRALGRLKDEFAAISRRPVLH
ncbi:AAA family ATPase [Rhodovulum visakhapatnamense]|uniref:ATPase family protein associated with various cellular activities (AAA) n=1 Tax=Rhodovulum visakhapatnamense TaxID=364297 RepID=A0A4R8F6Z6_9RHOB|nr:AAA family ATPase [Rhodovulum visakhapatnamense]TDX21109.1 ATPase family protein associated with various cellular activities (AAA) [Rhodovulum visakhapatnamense]